MNELGLFGARCAVPARNAASAARRAATVASIALACAGSTSAWAQSLAANYQPAEWAKIVAAAKKEGKVYFYSAQVVPLLQRIVAGFKKANPDIEIEATRGPSGELVTKLTAERANNLDGADVFLSTELLWFLERAREGGLRKPAGPSAPAWPSAYVREGTMVIGAVEPITILYNKAQVPNPPRGYADLLKPEFRGKIGVVELGSTGVIAWYDWLEKTQGSDYLVKLKAQNPKMYTVSSTLVQGVAAGEVQVGNMGNVTGTKPLIEKGAPVDFVVPNPGLGIVYAMAALGWSRRPNAALVLMDYLMSVEGQTVWHGRGEAASPLRGIPGSLDVSTITPWPLDAFNPEAVRKYREHWTAIFK